MQSCLCGVEKEAGSSQSCYRPQSDCEGVDGGGLGREALCGQCHKDGQTECQKLCMQAYINKYGHLLIPGQGSELVTQSYHTAL